MNWLIKHLHAQWNRSTWSPREPWKPLRSSKSPPSMNLHCGTSPQAEMPDLSALPHVWPDAGAAKPTTRPSSQGERPRRPPPRRGVANTGRGGGRRTEGSAEEAAFSFPRGHRRMRVCEVPSGKRAGWQRPRASRRALRGGSPRGFSSSCSFREPDCVPEAMLTSGLLTFGARAQGFRPLPVLSRMVGPGGNPPLPPPLLSGRGWSLLPSRWLCRIFWVTTRDS